MGTRVLAVPRPLHMAETGAGSCPALPQPEYPLRRHLSGYRLDAESSRFHLAKRPLFQSPRYARHPAFAWFSHGYLPGSGNLPEKCLSVVRGRQPGSAGKRFQNRQDIRHALALGRTVRRCRLYQSCRRKMVGRLAAKAHRRRSRRFLDRYGRARLEQRRRHRPPVHAALCRASRRHPQCIRTVLGQGCDRRIQPPQSRQASLPDDPRSLFRHAALLLLLDRRFRRLTQDGKQLGAVRVSDSHDAVRRPGRRSFHHRRHHRLLRRN